MENVKRKKSAIDIFGKCFEIFLLVFLILYCISLLVPLFWMVITSLKSNDEYLMSSFKLPEILEWKNYLSVFEKFVVQYTAKTGELIDYDIWGMAGYSILYTFARSFVHVLMGSMCAYVLAKFKFFGSTFLYNLGILIMIVPIVGSAPAMMLLRRQLGIWNNMFLLIITAEATAFSGLHFMLLYAAFKRIPKTYGEAVMIDGGNHYTTFFRIVLPMALPTMVAVFVLTFLATWSDYSTFIVWMPAYPSLSVGMYLFGEQAAHRTTMPVLLATYVVVIIPTTIIYLSTQKVLMSKFTVGGLKG